MLAEIGRNVTDAETPIRIAIILMRLDVARQRLGVLAVPGPVFLGQRERVARRVKMEGEDEIAVEDRRIGGEVECPSVAMESRVNFTAILQNIAKVVVGMGEVGTEP